MKNAIVVCTALAVILALSLSGCAAGLTEAVPADEATSNPAADHEDERLDSPAASPADMPGSSAEATGPTETPASTTPTEEESATNQPTQVPPATKVASGERQLVEIAKEDLARRMALSPREISVISLEAVEWSDASLGCPQPDMVYAQVITPGFLIVLEAADQTYEYHSDAGQLVILCQENEPSPVPLIPIDPDEIDDGEPWVPVH
jgi:hypothetical protein